MALPLNNTAEGGSNGTTVTAGNSGGASGDAFDTPVIGAGATLTFDSSQFMHGGLSYLIVQSGTIANTYTPWITPIPASLGELWGRIYFRFSGLPSTAQRIVRALNAAGNLCSVGLNTTGKIQWYATSTGNAATGSASTTTLSVNTWYRIDFHMLLSSGTAGQLDAQIFTTPDGTTPAETVSVASATTGLASVADEVRFGCVSGGIPSGSFWYDDLNVNAVGFPGPAIVVPSTPFFPSRMPLGV